jgi:hypothetical protein
LLEKYEGESGIGGYCRVLRGLVVSAQFELNVDWATVLRIFGVIFHRPFRRLGCEKLGPVLSQKRWLDFR